jgi:Tfp pilus assembly protein PilX
MLNDLTASRACSCSVAARRQQGGLVTMTVALLMLLVVSVLIFYTNKGIWLEQRSATNQYRAKQAQGAAEAGLEYMLSVLNTTSGTPRRSTYLTADNGQPGSFTIATNTLTGSPGNALAYTVVIAPLAGDVSPYNRFTISSTGGSDCSTTGTLSTCSGRAVTSQVVKLTPVLLTPPDDGASVYGSVTLSGNARIRNTTGIGFPIRTRTAAVTPGGSSTLDGSLTGNCGSVSGTNLAMCGSFSSISTTEQFFSSYFGSSSAEIKSQTTSITSDATLSTSTSGLVWYQGTLTLTKDVGSSANPVLLIVEGDLNLQGNSQIYGFVYVTGTMDFRGTADIVGAAAVAGDYNHLGTAELRMDRDVLDQLKATAASFNKVLGTWKDW